MIHTRWKKLVITVGLAMATLAVGIFLNVGVANAAENDPTVSVTLYTKGPDLSSKPKYFFRYELPMNISNGVTMNQFLDSSFSSLFMPGYDVFDSYNVIFKYGDDQPASYDKAVNEIASMVDPATLAAFPGGSTTPQEFAESSITDGFKLYDEGDYHSVMIDLHKTKIEATQKLALTKEETENSLIYQADFYIYLKSKPSDNIPVSPIQSDQSDLTANSSATITVGQKVDATTFNAQAKDSSGNELPVTVDTGQADLNKPGTYSIVLKADNGKTMTVKLTVNAAEVDTGTVTAKKSAIYGLKTLYLYEKPTFKQSQRIVKYAKAKRSQRPMFVVTGYAHSKAGLLRYQVKDINHNSKTAGKTGYVTAKKNFTAPVYYQKAAKRIKVLSTSGINVYKNMNLTDKTKHVKQGEALTITGIKKHNLTTRFILSNGQYITANKKLVMVVK